MSQGPQSIHCQSASSGFVRCRMLSKQQKMEYGALEYFQHSARHLIRSVCHVTSEPFPGESLLCRTRGGVGIWLRKKVTAWGAKRLRILKAFPRDSSSEVFSLWQGTQRI